MAKKQNKVEEIREKSIIIRPIGKHGGLDSIHLALIALSIILVLLVLSISYTKEIIIKNVSASNCTYGSINGTCAVPATNASGIRLAFERIIAGYATANSSLSLLPYFSNTSTISEQYLPYSRAWYAGIKGRNPATNQPFYFAALINDRNNSNFTPSVQVIKPNNLTENRLVSTGVLQLGSKYACSSQSPLQVYWFMDPYSPGAVASISNLTSLQKRFGSKINVTLKMLYTQSSAKIATAYGVAYAQALSGYLYCASLQPNFKGFVGDLQSLYTGGYVSPQSLSTFANQSGLNYSEISSCLGSYPQIFERQNLLSNYYNITSSPIVVTDCRYLSLPQTAAEAVCYANSSIC